MTDEGSPEPLESLESPDENEPTTDDEHEIVKVPVEKWKMFELSVADLIATLDPDATVEHDFSQEGVISGLPRQIDVLVSGDLGPTSIKIAVECKRYKKKAGIGVIDEFAGKLQDLGVDSGVLYCLNGYTKPAVARAANAVQPKIVLEVLPQAGPLHVDWGEVLSHFTGFGDCPNDNCWTGDIVWQSYPQPDGTSLEGGVCYACGTWAVRCLECEQVLGFHWATVECDDHVYHQHSDPDGSDYLTYE